MQSTPTTLSPVTLISVKEKFDHWRSTREKRGKIPAALWALVKPLAQRYKYAEIAHALKINYSQLKANLSHSACLDKKEITAIAFAECALPSIDATSSICTLEFTGKNGSTVKISGLTIANMQPLVSLLLGN